MTQIVKVLKGHTSPETAYLIEDYPYGFKLRTEKRVWIEEHPKKGFRLASQTRNPKIAGNPWNKVVYSTYVDSGAGMFLDEEGHVQWTGIGVYTRPAEISAFVHKFGSTPRLRAVIDFQFLQAKKYQAMYARGNSGMTINGQPIPVKPSDIERSEAEIATLEEIRRNWPE